MYIHAHVSAIVHHCAQALLHRKTRRVNGAYRTLIVNGNRYRTPTIALMEPF